MTRTLNASDSAAAVIRYLFIRRSPSLVQESLAFREASRSVDTSHGRFKLWAVILDSEFSVALLLSWFQNKLLVSGPRSDCFVRSLQKLYKRLFAQNCGNPQDNGGVNRDSNRVPPECKKQVHLPEIKITASPAEMVWRVTEKQLEADVSTDYCWRTKQCRPWLRTHRNPQITALFVSDNCHESQKGRGVTALFKKLRNSITET